jgi:mannosyltransferase
MAPIDAVYRSPGPALGTTLVSGDQHASPPVMAIWMAAGLTVVAAGLRLYDLGSQLWLDEIAALVHSIRRPFWDIATRFPGFIPHPLYELLAHAALATFGESAWAVRLPAAAFGILVCPVLYLLARRLVGPAESLLAAGLMTVSYHHVFFSQTARGYTLMIFFFVLSTLALLALRDAPSSPWWATYMVAIALTAYSLPFGAFALVGQAAVALTASFFQRRRGERAFGSLGSATALFALSAALVALLYLPFIVASLTYATTTGRQPGEGPRFSLALLPELLEGLRAGLGGPLALGAALICGVIGFASYLRRKPVALALLLAPTVMAALALVVIQVGVHPRYLLLVLPAGILIGARGLAATGAGLQLLGCGVGFAVPGWWRWPLVTLVIGAAATSLIGYYRTPKQDYLGALAEVRRLAGQDDRTVGADLAAHAFKAYYAPEFPGVEDLPELLHMEAGGQRVWVVTTLERVMASRKPDLLSHIRRHYRLVRILPGTVGDGAMRIYVREPAP